MNAVLDTNVLVAALLSPHGAPAQVLDLTLAGQLTLLVDDRILDEYRTVLRRPRFGFAQQDTEDLLTFLAQESVHVSAIPLKGTLQDPTDRPFLEVAMAGAEALVTGNIKHFPSTAAPGIRIMTPAQFLQWFAEF